MAKQTIRKTKTRVKTSGAGATYERCHICAGRGIVPKQHKKKK